MNKSWLSLLVFASLIFLTFGGGIRAEDVSISPSPTTRPVEVETDLPEKIRNTLRVDQEKRERIREKRETRLSELKLKACRARENAIKNRKESLLRLVTRHFKKMDLVLARVKDYYTHNLLSDGKKVENYDELLASVEKARENVVLSLEKASSLMENFSCESDDPKGVYVEFRKAMQETKGNLFEYRKAIKNLIVAVRTVAGTKDKVSPTETPETQ